MENYEISKGVSMRLYVSPLLLALVTTLLVPISAGAQESADCVGVYDWN